MNTFQTTRQIGGCPIWNPCRAGASPAKSDSVRNRSGRPAIPAKLRPCRQILLAGLLAGAFFIQTEAEAQQPVSVSCLLNGRNKICFLAQDGKVVRKGEALVVFNPEGVIQALRAADAAVQEAENKVRGIENELSSLSAGQDARRKPLEVEQQEAARVLERYKLVDQPLTEKRLQQAVVDADCALSNEKEKCESRDELLKQKAIRKNEWEEAGLKVQRASLAAETAHANLDAHLKYEKVPQTDRLTEVLAQKDAAVKAFQAAFVASKTAQEASLAAAKAQSAALQASRARQQEQLTQTANLATADGIFKTAIEPGSTAKLNLGSEVGEGQLLGTIETK